MEKETTLGLRLTKDEKDRIKQLAKQNKFKNVSEFIRFVVLNCQIEVKVKK